MKKTLVIGSSINESRYSNLAIRRLLERKHPVIGLGLSEGQVGGVVITSEKKAFTDIDTVTLYISVRHQPEYYQYILSLKPKRVIFNPGTYNSNFIQILEENNIETEIACTLVLLSTNQY